MRRSEITGMTWDLVNLKKRIVTFLNTKIGEKRIVLLSTEAGRVLSNLPRRLDGNVWRVESVFTSGREVEVKSLAKRVLDKWDVFLTDHGM